MKTMITRILACAVLALPLPVLAEEGAALDPAPVNLQDAESLQRGAKLFVNYCLSCHGAQAMRYNRLMDLGLTAEQIKDNMIFTGGVDERGEYKPTKVGQTMRVGLQPYWAKQYFGAMPPDLSVVARSRGADWLYTYLRSFYRDPSRPSGWNNAVFDKVSMPHVLWAMQGDQVLNIVDGDVGNAGKNVTRAWAGEEIGKDGAKAVKTYQLVLTRAGSQTRLDNGHADTVAYDGTAADLVNYLVWMGEPAQVTRERIGYGVLLFLVFVLAPISYLLKREYWRDVH